MSSFGDIIQRKVAKLTRLGVISASLVLPEIQGAQASSFMEQASDEWPLKDAGYWNQMIAALKSGNAIDAQVAAQQRSQNAPVSHGYINPAANAELVVKYLDQAGFQDVSNDIKAQHGLGRDSNACDPDGEETRETAGTQAARTQPSEKQPNPSVLLSVRGKRSFQKSKQKLLLSQLAQAKNNANRVAEALDRAGFCNLSKIIKDHATEQGAEKKTEADNAVAELKAAIAQWHSSESLKRVFEHDRQFLAAVNLWCERADFHTKSGPLFSRALEEKAYYIALSMISSANLFAQIAEIKNSADQGIALENAHGAHDMVDKFTREYEDAMQSAMRDTKARVVDRIKPARSTVAEDLDGAGFYNLSQIIKDQAAEKKTEADNPVGELKAAIAQRHSSLERVLRDNPQFLAEVDEWCKLGEFHTKSGSLCPSDLAGKAYSVALSMISCANLKFSGDKHVSLVNAQHMIAYFQKKYFLAVQNAGFSGPAFKSERIKIYISGLPGDFGLREPEIGKAREFFQVLVPHPLGTKHKVEAGDITQTCFIGFVEVCHHEVPGIMGKFDKRSLPDVIDALDSRNFRKKDGSDKKLVDSLREHLSSKNYLGRQRLEVEIAFQSLDNPKIVRYREGKGNASGQRTL